MLNEADVGLKRSGYRDVARDIADALGMHYAFAVEFVEVDPLTLGTERFETIELEDEAEVIAQLQVDRDRTRALHGNAILSRYPLENVRVVRFAHQGHDWYRDELASLSALERGKRLGAQVAFAEEILREVRRGGRMMLLADVRHPALPGEGLLTVVNTHLEARAKPESRVRQLREVLEVIAPLRHPVVLAGDMNTTGTDARPTSLPRSVVQRLGSTDYWLANAAQLSHLALPYSAGITALGGRRGLKDPTATWLWRLWRNDEAPFFQALERFKFEDGGTFDFRGNAAVSHAGRRRTLANSNERAKRGFVPTFELRRSFGLAQMKLDWIFVKPPALSSPRDRSQPYTFAPHRGRTLRALNGAGAAQLSDHAPVVVDLPLTTSGSPGQ